MNSKSVAEALDWRYATKQYDASKKISSSDWEVLADSLVKAPSSYGLQPWRFVVVQSEELRKNLKAVSWNQSQVTDCSHYVVFQSKKFISEKDIKDFIARISEVRGVPTESLKGYEDMMIQNVAKGMPASNVLSWTQRQAYIAMGFLLESAALLKIDTTPIEGLDPTEYDKILGVDTKEWQTVAAVALGYRSNNDAYQKAKKIRFKTERVIFYK